MAQVVLEHVSFSYPGAAAPALCGVSLTVEQGEFVLVCGESGCGKTTLLRHLVPALAPLGERSGTVFVEGAGEAGSVAFVAQDPDEQVVCDTVWHELAFGLENLGVEQGEMRLRVAEMASYFGIGGWFRRRVSELSGGQKQLLNLAAAMVLQPRMLVLDEPTSQLDPIAAGSFLATVRRLNEELGVTVVMCEHRLEEAYPLASKVVVMDSGLVELAGDPRDVARRLTTGGRPMARALPTPARVAGACAGLTWRLPLSVREGRAWLGAALDSGDTGPKDAPSEEPDTSANTGAPALKVRDAWFRYGRDEADVLRGTSLEVYPGELFALLGGNGAGKSTLLKAICGLCRVQRGSVEVLGRTLRAYRGNDLFRRGLAMLPQDPASLFAHGTVAEELLEMGNPAGVGKVEELCGIGHLAKCHPRDLSGGERQLVALAKVLLTEPRLILLDEPTKGLDACSKERVADVLSQLAGQGVAVLMVSHDVEFCAEHASRVGMFFDGEVVSQAAPQEFFSTNAFYTTAARRMGRGLVDDAVTVSDLVRVLR